jgi:hypothetical protein
MKKFTWKIIALFTYLPLVIFFGSLFAFAYIFGFENSKYFDAFEDLMGNLSDFFNKKIGRYN